MRNFESVKGYLANLGLPIVHEDAGDELVMVEDAEFGAQLAIDCEAPIVVLEAMIMPVPGGVGGDFFRRLLQMNRTLVHGAFVLNEHGDMVIFRDTLELANLDSNELEGSINALSLALTEHSAELLSFF